MKAKKQSPIWPYLGILACLFVLSVTAPRAWERMARQETLSQMLAARDQRTVADREARDATSYEPVDVAELETPEPLAPAATAESLVEAPASDIPITLVNPPHTAVPPVFPPAPEFAAQVREREQPAEPDQQPADEAPSAEIEPAATPADEIADEETSDVDRWPLPRVLLAQLDGIVAEDPQATWAGQAGQLIRELCQPPASDPRPANDVLLELASVLDGSKSEKSETPRIEAEIVRARYALTRWLGIWEPAIELDTTTTLTAEREAGGERVAESLAEVEAQLRGGSTGAAWRKYLELDALARLLEAEGETVTPVRRAMARKVLDRLVSIHLTRAQRKFISEGPIAKLQAELRDWAAAPVAAQQLLAHLDQYEDTGLPSDALAVADDWRGLQWTTSAQAGAISKHLKTHYRNANVRVALSKELINMLVPQPDAVEAPFRDTVVNVPVYGRNTTFTDLTVRLVPDPQRIRLGLEADGLVASDSVSTSGPATFYNAGQSTFLVRKLLVLGPDGLAVWPAVAEADNNFNYLKSLETDYDGMPIVGSLVRGIARSQHDEKREQARMEVERKVAIRARDQLDAEVQPRLVQAAERIEKGQMATLRRLGLEILPVGLSTTEDRAVARALLAGPEQLGAHTPRPRAPSDSWASLQIHQSALNNGLERLDFKGREFTLDELFAWIAGKVGRPDLAKQEDLPEDVRLRFAVKDAVRVQCANDRVEVLIAFAELKQGSRRWRNFTVRTFYRPEPVGLAPTFVRDSAIFIDGKNIKARPHLYAIFSKVLSQKRDFRLLEESLTNDKRFSRLAVSQFVVEQGWIGLAYSPARPTGNVVRRTGE